MSSRNAPEGCGGGRSNDPEVVREVVDMSALDANAKGLHIHVCGRRYVCNATKMFFSREEKKTR